MGIVASQAVQAGQLHNDNTLEMVRKYLDLASFRHKVLSQNIANVNTPGYKANEVNLPQKFTDLVGKSFNKKLGLKVTSNRHMAGRYSESSHFQARKLKDPFETKPNGNNVSLTQQVTKLSQNQTLYDTALKAYTSSSSLVPTVLGK